jgi:hypothetical protein
MAESKYSKIVREKLSSFMNDPKTQPEFLKILRVIESSLIRKLGKYYDPERHSTLQLLLDCLDSIKSGKRHWDYKNVKIEAMFYNAARSLLGNYIRKEKASYDKMEIHLEPYRSAEGYECFSEEDVLDYNNIDEEAYNSEFNTFYDKENIKIVEKVLKNDKTALKVMESLMNSNSNIIIAKRLKIKVRDVENALKRIRRAGKKVLTIIGKQNHRTNEEIRVEILKRE